MIIPILLLISFSVTVIYSSSPPQAIQQALYAVIGLVGYFLLQRFDYRSISPLLKYMYWVILILLVITFIIGFESRGSVRWIPLGLFNFQPSEFAKIVMILCLAFFWTYHKPTWKNIAKSIGILAPMAILIFRQPDLGTMLTVLFIWITMLLASHISFLKLGLFGLLGMIGIPTTWLFLHDYQKQRIYSFLSPSTDPQGIGFHVIQSMIAVGSGQIWGRGLGRGTQSRLQFLPEFRTDFIFAFIAEELGLTGSLLVILFYSTIFYFMFKIIGRAGDRFGELIVLGVFGMMFFQITVNIGMNIGVLPITGITLPFLSYGGSSMITTLLSFGLVASVARFGIKKRDTSVIGDDE
jgi:rod shape determining protein RodA